MTKVVIEHLMTVFMAHCDERGHGSLPLQGLWSIVMRVVMEDRDESGQEAL